MLQIFAAGNLGGATLARYRRSRMEEQYAGAVFDQMPQRKFGFVLSGTRGEGPSRARNVLLRWQDHYGWQMTFPVSDRMLTILLRTR